MNPALPGSRAATARHPLSFLASCAALVLLVGCSLPVERTARFERLGPYGRAELGTADDEARFWFDQGLSWTYGFNHAEAVRSFQMAQRLDPEFALAHWGEAYALGPNINAPMSPDAEVEARAAVDRALALREFALPAEVALIEALDARYARAPGAGDEADAVDRDALNAAFADAMADVHRRFPGDPDIAVVFADARMNQQPWDYWTEDGAPKSPGVQEALDTVRRVIANDPAHPGAHHLHIHLTESHHPDQALESAQVLASLMPGSGHLVHMPAHILHRVGNYQASEEHNRLAIELDRAYFAKAGPQGLYEFYLAHNHHFRAWSAMFGGRFAPAREAARGLVEDLPPGVDDELAPFADGFLATELHVLVRFGRWDDVLAFPEFGEQHPIARTMRHYARGIAFAATGRVEQALAEQRAFEAACADVPEEAMIGINSAPPILAVARDMLAGEILYRQGDHDGAFAKLAEAAAAEDALRYDEPRGWMTPVRHAIGALALEQCRIELAETAYREDLERNPENGWALHGLAECLRQKGEVAEADAVQARFAIAWQHADTDLTNGSCFCRGALDAGPVGEAGGCCSNEAAAGAAAASCCGTEAGGEVDVTPDPGCCAEMPAVGHATR
jgi:tetratricopeptide (TPR) repeat protein